jgi:hypothetical protein
MLEMVIPLEAFMQVSHAHGEMFVRKFIHHLGSNSFAGVLVRTPRRTNPSNEALR